MPRKMIFTEEDIKQFSPDLRRAAPSSASSPHARSRSEPAKVRNSYELIETCQFRTVPCSRLLKSTKFLIICKMIYSTFSVKYVNVKCVMVVFPQDSYGPIILELFLNWKQLSRSCVFVETIYRFLSYELF